MSAASASVDHHAGSAPRCTSDALWREHPLLPRMTLDYELHLFENMYKAGPHKLERGRLVHATPPAHPLVVHFNGPAKVTAIDCEVRARLARLYRPWNRKLYAMLRRDEETPAAPAGEPPFRPFRLRVLCYNSSSPKIHIE